MNARKLVVVAPLILASIFGSGGQTPPEADFWVTASNYTTIQTWFHPSRQYVYDYIYEYDFNNDGTYDIKSDDDGPIGHIFDSAGEYVVGYRITDKATGREATASTTVYVNDASTVSKDRLKEIEGRGPDRQDYSASSAQHQDQIMTDMDNRDALLNGIVRNTLIVTAGIVGAVWLVMIRRWRSTLRRFAAWRSITSGVFLTAAIGFFVPYAILGGYQMYRELFSMGTGWSSRAVDIAPFCAVASLLLSIAAAPVQFSRLRIWTSAIIVSLIALPFLFMAIRFIVMIATNQIH